MTITAYVAPSWTTTLPTGIWSGVNGYPVLPYLIGQSFEVDKAPTYSTKVVRSASGRTRKTAYWPYPIWEFTLKYEVIRHKASLPELFTMWEFFNAAQGKFGTWLYVDPSDNQLTSQYQFATGDGTTTLFTLARPLNSVYEPVFSVYGQTVQVAGVTKTAGVDYTLGSNGSINFTTAPANGAAITWAGYFYFGCEFDQDNLTLKQMINTLWKGDSLKFRSVRV